MSLNRVSRAERFLENAVAFGKITSSGKDFLVAALDPFHDMQLKDLQGWPDLETSSSVVRLIKQTLSVKALPGTLTPWDMYIDLWPWLNSLLFLSTASGAGSRRNELVTLDTNTIGSFIGGLTVYGTTAGAAVNYNSQTSQIGKIDLPDEYSAGAHRIIGIGFEVVDTTAEIYRQGQAIVYRQSNPVNKPTGFKVKSGPLGVGSTDYYTYCPIPSPPTTIPQTLLVPGTRQWAAEEGCYVVGCFVGQDNPPHIVGYTPPAVFATAGGFDTAYNISNNPNPTGPNTSILLVPPPMLFPGSATSIQQPVVVHPMHMCGARFVGLNPQSTFAVTLNVYLETFPTVAEPGILVLATPSAQYDPVALEIFSNALSTLPVGVMVKENGLGDWFSDAIMTTAKYVSPVLDAAGFSGLAKGAQAVGKLARDWRVENGYMAAPSPGPRTIPQGRIRALPAPVPKPTNTGQRSRKKRARKKKSA